MFQVIKSKKLKRHFQIYVDTSRNKRARSIWNTFCNSTGPIGRPYYISSHLIISKNLTRVYVQKVCCSWRNKKIQKFTDFKILEKSSLLLNQNPFLQCSRFLWLDTGTILGENCIWLADTDDLYFFFRKLILLRTV